MHAKKAFLTPLHRHHEPELLPVIGSSLNPRSQPIRESETPKSYIL